MREGFKCAECGLVQWRDGEAPCKRCGAPAPPPAAPSPEAVPLPDGDDPLDSTFTPYLTEDESKVSNPAQRLAFWSWVLPIVGFVVGRFAFTNTALLDNLEFVVLAYALLFGPILLALLALLSTGKHGSAGVILPSLVGIILCVAAGSYWVSRTGEIRQLQEDADLQIDQERGRAELLQARQGAPGAGFVDLDRICAWGRSSELYCLLYGESIDRVTNDESSFELKETGSGEVQLEVEGRRLLGFRPSRGGSFSEGVDYRAGGDEASQALPRMRIGGCGSPTVDRLRIHRWALGSDGSLVTFGAEFSAVCPDGTSVVGRVCVGC